MTIRIFAFAIILLSLGCAPIKTETPTPTPVPSSDSDPEMEAAFVQARDSLDDFIERIGTPRPNRTLVAIKVRFFPPDDSPQDIWVDGVTYADGSFHGNMGDDIPSLRLFAGDKVTVKPEEVLDWMLVEDGKLIGGYTIRLAYQRMSPAEKANFLESLDYSLDD